MKKYSLILMALVASLLLIAQCGKPKGEWVAKIDGHPILLKDFNQRYQMYQLQLQQQPDYKPLSADDEKKLKAELLKNMIGEYLIVKQLKKEKFDKTDDAKAMIDQVLIQEYLKNKYAADLTVSQPEIDQFYKQNKAYFKNMDPTVAMQRIQYQLTVQKFQEKTAEIIDRLYGKAKIVKNETALVPVTLPGIPAVSNTEQTKK